MFLIGRMHMTQQAALLVGWLIGWLVDQLVGQSIGCLDVHEHY